MLLPRLLEGDILGLSASRLETVGCMLVLSAVVVWAWSRGSGNMCDQWQVLSGNRARCFIRYLLLIGSELIHLWAKSDDSWPVVTCEEIPLAFCEELLVLFSIAVSITAG